PPTSVKENNKSAKGTGVFSEQIILSLNFLFDWEVNIGGIKGKRSSLLGFGKGETACTLKFECARILVRRCLTSVDTIYQKVLHIRRTFFSFVSSLLQQSTLQSYRHTRICFEDDFDGLTVV